MFAVLAARCGISVWLFLVEGEWGVVMRSVKIFVDLREPNCAEALNNSIECDQGKDLVEVIMEQCVALFREKVHSRVGDRFGKVFTVG